MQVLIVGFIVFGAAAYVAWHWLPAALRKRAGSVHPSLAKVPGCYRCDSGCGGCAKADTAPSGSTQPRAIAIVSERQKP